ncbi:hypothetical protein Tco_1365298, partial [Tanacetum coccineum]
PSGEKEKQDAEHLENKDSEVPNTEEPRVNQDQDESVNNTNNINTVSSIVNTASIEDNVVDENTVYGCADDPNMPNLEEIVYSEDVGNYRFDETKETKRFYTSAGNPVKEILLKLNLPYHRSILTDSKMEVK